MKQYQQFKLMPSTEKPTEDGFYILVGESTEHPTCFMMRFEKGEWLAWPRTPIAGWLRPVEQVEGAMLEQLLKKYMTIRDNILWHIRTNNPPEEEIKKLNRQADDYLMVMKDLESLRSHQPSERQGGVSKQKIRHDLIWEMIEAWQMSRDKYADPHAPLLSYNDVEVELYEWFEKEGGKKPALPESKGSEHPRWYIPLEELCDIAQNACQLLNGIKPDAIQEKWWSEWDESVFQSLLSIVKRLSPYYNLPPDSSRSSVQGNSAGVLERLIEIVEAMIDLGGDEADLPAVITHIRNLIKQGVEYNPFNSISGLAPAAGEGNSKGVDVRERYSEWCRLTKRNGKILVGSMQEFFDWLDQSDRAAGDDELAQLRQWKKEQMEVMNRLDIQAIGKELAIPLGETISDKILPAIKALKIAAAQQPGAVDAVRFIDWIHENKEYRWAQGEKHTGWWYWAESDATDYKPLTTAELYALYQHQQTIK